MWLKGAGSATYDYGQGGQFRLKQPLTKLKFRIWAQFPFYSIVPVLLGVNQIFLHRIHQSLKVI